MVKKVILPAEHLTTASFSLPELNFSASIDEVTEMLLFDPQTSGGLLIACPPEKLDEFISEAKKLKQQFWVIGHAEAR